MARFLLVAILLALPCAVAWSGARAKPTCARIIAANVKFEDLLVVGLIKQGDVQKALLMDRSTRAYIVHRGECVARERVPFAELRLAEHAHP